MSAAQHSAGGSFPADLQVRRVVQLRADAPDMIELGCIAPIADALRDLTPVQIAGMDSTMGDLS